MLGSGFRFRVLVLLACSLHCASVAHVTCSPHVIFAALEQPCEVLGHPNLGDSSVILCVRICTALKLASRCKAHELPRSPLQILFIPPMHFHTFAAQAHSRIVGTFGGPCIRSLKFASEFRPMPGTVLEEANIKRAMTPGLINGAPSHWLGHALVAPYERDRSLLK